MKVGIQLYSVRDEMAKDPIKAIEKVASIGYKNLEVANPRADEDPGVGFNVPADKLQEILSGFDAHVVSSHIRPFTPDTADAIIAYHESIGNKYIGQSADFWTSKENLLERCRYYNEMGKLCAAHGMKFLYHNHYHEFQKLEGKYILYHIMENTDPAYVDFELDTFWAMRGGADLIEVMKTLGKRLSMIHQKDFSKTAPSELNVLKFKGLEEIKSDADFISHDNFQGGFDHADFCEIGTGIMDIQKILDTGNELGVKFVVLEQDFSQHEQLESVQISMDSFRKYKGIEF